MTPSRINPDSRAVLVVATVATAALALVSFLLSFNGLADAAAWANVPGWLAWAIPAYVDGAILVYTLAALVFRARGESARLEWAALGVFAALSVAANGVHAWETAPAGLRATLGVLLAALAPVSVVLTTHTIARLIVAPPAPVADIEWRDAAVRTLSEVAEASSRYAARAEEGPGVTPEPQAPAERMPDPEPFKLADLPRVTTEHRNARIRELDGEGLSLREIAARVGVSKSTVSRVLNRHPDDEAA